MLTNFLVKHRGLVMKNSKKVLPETFENNQQRTDKCKTVKDVCVQPVHPISETQLLTYKEVAQKLKVCERTVRRLVDANELKCIYIRHSPRVRETDLQDYLNEQQGQCYNHKRMVLDVRRKSKGKRTCKNRKRKTVYSNDQIQNSGGPAMSTNPAKELADLLAQ